MDFSKLSMEEIQNIKTDVYIATEIKLGYRPRVSRSDRVGDEVFFDDDQDMGIWRDSLRQRYEEAIKKLEEKKKLTKGNQRNIKLYEKILKNEQEHNIFIYEDYILHFKREEFKQAVINNIGTLNEGEIPNYDENGKKLVFSFDHQEMYDWFYSIRARYVRTMKCVENGKKLSETDERNVEFYRELLIFLEEHGVRISKLISLDSITQLEIDKIKKAEFIKKTRELGHKPRKPQRRKKGEVAFLIDGTDMGSWFSIQSSKARNIRLAKDISLEECEYLEIYDEIKRIANYYPIRKRDRKKLIKELCLEYGIDIDSNNDLLDKPCSEVYVKLRYLKDIRLDINKNMRMFYMSDFALKKSYGVDLDWLLDTYIFNQKDVNKIRNK